MKLSNDLMLSAKEAETFREELRKRRKEAGLTGTAFAELMGCSLSHLSCVENGKKTPSLMFVRRVADLLNIQVSDMLHPAPSEFPDDRASYGKKLFARRMDKNINALVIANALGMPVNVYKEIERGKCSITENQKEILNKLLDIDKKSNPAPATVVTEVVNYVPTHICDLIIDHVKDLQIDTDKQKALWRYFTDMKISAQERELFG